MCGSHPQKKLPRQVRLLFPGEIVRVCGWEKLLKVREEGAETTLEEILPQEEKMGDSLAEQAHDQASRCWQGDFPKTAEDFVMPNSLRIRIGKTKRTGEKFTIILIILTEQSHVLDLESDSVVTFI